MENNYLFWKKCLGWFFKILFPCEVYGQENEITKGGVIIAPNHLSMADVIIIGMAFKRPLKFMAKSELFRFKFIGKFLSSFGAYPIQRGKGDISAIKNTVSLLKDDFAVTIFPQGTRCPGIDPQETKFKSGVAMIASRADVPIVPVLISNKRWRILPFVKNKVVIGSPIKINNTDIKGSEQYNTFTEVLKNEICNLSVK